MPNQKAALSETTDPTAYDLLAGKTREQLIDHIVDDGLVLAEFNRVELRLRTEIASLRATSPDRTTELLPCPFCGAAAALRWGAWAGVGYPPKFGIECTGCSAWGKTCGSSEEAAQLWNQRAA